MAGVKGKSGRRPKADELRIIELVDKSVNWAIKNFNKLSRGEKIKIVTQVAPKYIPQETKLTGNFTFAQMIEVVSKDDNGFDRNRIEASSEN